MNIGIRGRRSVRRFAFGLALVVSGCVQVILLVASNSLAVTPGQKQSGLSGTPASAKDKGDDTSFTRPRRIETPTTSTQKYPSSSEGPMIRVALMTDVSTVSVTSSYPMTVRRTDKDSDAAKRIDGGSMRVELRRGAGSPETIASSGTSYTVRATTLSDERKARKLVQELKKKFFESITMSFDDRQKEYSVLIGGAASHSEATRLAQRLRLAGYEEARVITNPVSAAESVLDTNARAAKHKAEPASVNRAGAKAEHQTLQMVAIAAERPRASSDAELIISALTVPLQKDAIKEAAALARTDVKRRATKSNSIDEQTTGASKQAAPPSLRIADKDYRGEIHLVLNSRGRIDIVNWLPLEEYLRGVVPMELSPGQFPELEALKAQAVAARSYAVARLGQHRNETFDLVDDARAQVYGGLSAERELSNRAIQETRGIVAAYPNEDGNLVAIEALYTANCGGRTENNEEVFGGTPMPYLRGVSCALDERSASAREIATRRAVEPLTGIEGRSLAREVALLSVLGFSLPRRVTAAYLKSPPADDELRNWLDQIAQLSHKEKPRVPRGDAGRFVEFLRLVASSRYGEGRASTLLAPADVDYVLEGLPIREIPREARADVAMLLRDGILHLPASGAIEWRATVTRGQAIDVIACAFSSTEQAGISKPQASYVAQTQIQSFKSDVTAGAQKGRLLVSSSRDSASTSSSRLPGSRFQSTNATAVTPRSSIERDRRQDGTSAAASSTNPTPKKASEESQISIVPGGIEVAEDAWLFRKLGDVSYPVERLTLLGGERVTYHLNEARKIDFLEASISDRGAASDRFSAVAQWQERMSPDSIRQRLASSRINVGRIDNIEPVAFTSSNRVSEIEITGEKGRARLARPQIRAALGLREYLFTVDRETDQDGRVVAFVFNGRGWGHGVGMCQIGAYGLAREGYSYTAILQKYYTGIKLQKMY